MDNYDETIHFFDEQLLRVQKDIVNSDSSQKYLPKLFFHVHLFNLIPIPEYSKLFINQIRTIDVGRYIQVTGTIVRIGMVKIIEKKRVYVCPKCK